MNIIYAHDNYYYQNSSGSYSTGQFSASYWQTYLDSFGSMTILGRRLNTGNTSKMNRSDGVGITIKTLPNMNSPKDLLKNYTRNKRDIDHMVKGCDGVIIRAMSELGWLTYLAARKYKKPIAHEMSGCPWDNTWNHGGLIAKIYAPLRYIRARIVAHNATQVLYVTRDFLPKRYPAGKNAVTISASNVRINKPHEDVLQKRISRITQLKSQNDGIFRIGLIGQLHHKLKGIEVAIKAIADITTKTQKTVELHILGPGNPEALRTLAHEYKVENHIFFDGTLPEGDAVLNWLDDIDLYIQPSFHEGLPRGLIEAMSRGCPALSSTAGGMPELLPQENLHKSGDHGKLAKDITTIIRLSTEHLIEEATQNFKTSLNYTQDKLQPRRQKFWQKFADTVKAHKKAI